VLDQESDEFLQLVNRLLVELRSRGPEVPKFTEEEASRLIELIDVAVWLIYSPTILFAQHGHHFVGASA
jgi:hypothetical protein